MGRAVFACSHLADSLRRRVALWAPVVLYMAFIFALSSISHPPDLPAAIGDKGAHALLYAGLGALLVRALAGGLRRPVTPPGRCAAVALSTSCTASTDEIHQHVRPVGTPTSRSRCRRLGWPLPWLLYGVQRSGRASAADRVFPIRSRNIIRIPMAFDNLLVDRDGPSPRHHQPAAGPERPQPADARRAPPRRARARAGRRACASIVLTGAGDKAFVAGADINELAVQSPAAGREHALARAACLRSDREPRQAGDRGDQRLRARRRLRAGDGVHAAARRRHGEARAAGDQPRPHSRLRRDAAAAAAGRQGKRARDDAHRHADRRRRGRADRPRQPRRAGGRADGRGQEAGGATWRRRRRSRCATSSRRSTTASKCRLPRRGASRRRCSGWSRRPTTCAKERARFSRSASRSSRAGSNRSACASAETAIRGEASSKCLERAMNGHHRRSVGEDALRSSSKFNDFVTDRLQDGALAALRPPASKRRHHVRARAGRVRNPVGGASCGGRPARSRRSCAWAA